MCCGRYGIKKVIIYTTIAVYVYFSVLFNAFGVKLSSVSDLTHIFGCLLCKDHWKPPAISVNHLSVNAMITYNNIEVWRLYETELSAQWILSLPVSPI